MLLVDIPAHGMQQRFISKRDLAKKWGVDHRHTVFTKLQQAATAEINGKTRELFDSALSRSRALDYLRCKRQTPMRQAALIKFLSAEYGPSWFEETAKLMK